MKTLSRFAALSLLGCVFIVAPLKAQTAQQQTPQQKQIPQQTAPPPPPASAVAPAPSAADVDPKTFAAAKDLVRSFDMSNLMQSVFNVMAKTMLPLIMRDNPNQSQQGQQLIIDAVQKTFMAHMDEFENNKAIVYAQMYSYDEIMQLKTFYQSPIGQKMLKTMPDMMQKTMVMDQSIILKSMDEAKRSIAESLRKSGMKVPREMDL